MSIDPGMLLAIAMMSAVTYFTRLAGFLLASRLSLRGRARAAIDAIPPAVLFALIAPVVLTHGWPETLAAAAAGIAALRLPLLGVIAIGIAAVVILRALF
ncbi:AzlD domain-containing protein [Pseudochelatococcus contaminans]|uniref:Putative membrane protein n=1 Tax=Pseudochelatococcus contaminans TaxID=1538103 RepID=A0A7W5Z2A4_9HYPH|nr:putative membrane protein [Pseudochelatococcus contaminans]